MLRIPIVLVVVAVLVSLGMVGSALTALGASYLRVGLGLTLLFFCFLIFHYRGKAARIDGLELERAHWTTLLDMERAERTKQVHAERDRWRRALELEKCERVASFARRDCKWYQSFDRVLAPDDEGQFCSIWSETLGDPIEVRYLRYLQHRINKIENLCLGRLAGSVQDAILRVLVACSIKDDALRFLEIGTLFGVNAITIYDIASCFFKQVKLTMIDPLDGYYGSGKLDILTGLPVTRGVLHRNLNRLMIPAEDYSIIQEYSTSQTAVELARRENYNFVFIDGDHTYEGVRADFELYSPMLETSGYLVFDDYRSESWPGVQRFVDEVVLQSPVYESIGASWRSIVFRRR